MKNSIFFKIITLILNFIFYRILTDNLSSNIFGELIYLFSISLSISILSNLGSDTIVSKLHLKSKGDDFFNGNISYNDFHIITLIIATISSPIISIIYGITNIEQIFVIFFVSLTLTNARVFGSNFLSIKKYFFYYFFSIFGFLLFLVILTYFSSTLFKIFLISSILMNIFLGIINYKYKFIRIGIFKDLNKINIQKINLILSKTYTLIIILFLAASHELLSQYWLKYNFGYILSGQVAILFRIASLTVIGLAALNLTAYSSFNKTSNIFNNEYNEEYFKILKISLFISLPIIFGIFLSHKFILNWFNLPLNTEILLSLFILIIGQFFVVCMGPISMAMTQFNKQKVFSIFYIFGCCINVILLFSYSVISEFISMPPLVYSTISYSLCFFSINLIAFVYFFYNSKLKKI